jgi:hypothetical protein
MPVPKLRCNECGKLMTYDPILSKKRSKTQLRSFWCTNCEYIMVEEKFTVKDVVKSVKRYLMYGKLP